MAAARAYLEAFLAAGGDAALRDPARFTLCRIATDAGQRAQAIACLERFRRDFPGSPHDQEALLVRGQLAELQGGCAAARPWREEYLRRYPRGRFAARVARRVAGCRR